jgi:hypothetical protein
MGRCTVGRGRASAGVLVRRPSLVQGFSGLLH